MLRYRRYRAFVVFAVFAVIGLYYHIAGHGTWTAPSAIGAGSFNLPGKLQSAIKSDSLGDLLVEEKQKSDVAQAAPTPPKETSATPSPNPATLIDELPIDRNAPAKTPRPTKAEVVKSKAAAIQTPKVKLEGLIEEVGQGRLEATSLSASSAIHWISQSEHFPVKTIIPLPTGKPKSIPRIQHKFGTESQVQKEDRLKKVDAIKDVLTLSWKGYKDNAWLHDEVMPNTGGSKDPFCGWAATLVDSLDTLWIVGLKDEFEEAVEAVGTIDFTISSRHDIPLFETTIRYLGGMLAAYDVSGAKYKILLDKAVELADILMGAFDTPNRMPMTYYNWRPAFASQPHRATTRVVLAELGSLSMEFTRLAQLTSESSYYDAIARITDAFEEWQFREPNSTMLPGLWPKSVDASGCEKPAQVALGSGGHMRRPQRPMHDDNDDGILVGNGPPPVGLNPEKAIPVSGERTKNLKPSSPKIKDGKAWRDEDPETGRAGGRKIVGWNDPVLEGSIDSTEAKEKLLTGGSTAADEPSAPQIGGTSREDDVITKGKAGGGKIAGWGNPIKEGTLDSTEAKEKLLQGDADDLTGSIKSKRQLSGALEDDSSAEIRTSHIATNKPDAHMSKFDLATDGDETQSSTPDVPVEDPNVLHGAAGAPATYTKPAGHPKKPSSGRPEETEICIDQGLMSSNRYGSDRFSLGGEADSTYEYLPKEYLLLGGLEDKYRKMYEKAIDTATEYLLYRPMTPDNQDILFAGEWNAFREENGDLNGTLHYEGAHLTCFVGGMYALGAKIFNRPEDLELAAQLTEGCVWAYASTATGIMPEAFLLQPCKSKLECEWNETEYYHALDPMWESRDEMLKVPKVSHFPLATETKLVQNEAKTPSSKPDTSHNKARRDLADDDITTLEGLNAPQRDKAAIAGADAVLKANANGNRYADEDVVGLPPTGTTTLSGPPPGAQPADTIEEPAIYTPPPPPTHKEYVESRIKDERLPPGFTRMSSRRYMLRPEAIESVWYMYRITGNAHWREVGWEMFKAVDKHTRAKYGNSAIDDVTKSEPELEDGQESFWMAETLKYFYLLFADEDVISLDEWVLNTEAHPFRRPDANPLSA